ncbi:MAG: hypothetical protein ACSHXB_16325 [Sulfitobacter sp.]
MNALRGVMTLVICVVGLLGIGMALLAPLEARATKANQKIATVSRDINVLQGRIDAIKNAKDQGTTPEGLIVETTDQLSAELGLQTTILDLATEFGLAPNNFGPTILGLEMGLQTVGFELEFESGFENSFAFITALERHTPRIAIETLWIRHIPLASLPEEETPVSVQLSVWQFWRATKQEN